MSDILFERALLWIVLLPLAGAIANGVAGRFASKRLVGSVAVGSVAIAFVLSVLCFVHLLTVKDPHENARISHEVYEWFTLHLPEGRAVPVRVAFVMDTLSGIMALVVTGIGLLIHVYSLEYMADDPGFARFFTYLNLFMASMLILILASSMPLMFVGWEGVGLCSYLLIGFWWETPEYAAAGKKAFLYNRVGDFGVLIGMFLLVTTIGSFEFQTINENAAATGRPFVLFQTELGTVATVASLFLFLGCTGKSAQIPLFTWLPDAMAGPTPVSALIHAATMVTAGVYLCARLSGIFSASPVAMGTIAVVGALTALLAASIALVQNQMKKILAYSTVSQLGFMFAAIGAGAFAAGIFHVFTHAFFKACLFLGAGAVMHAVHAHGDADIRRLGGMRKYLPTVHWTFLVSCLAIAGVPLFSGFFSKDEILYGALLSHDVYGADWAWLSYAVFGVLVLAAVMTAFYMFRLYFLTFTGDYRSLPVPAREGADTAAEQAAHDHHAVDHGYDPHPHRPGPAIAWPLIILGVGAVTAGYLGLPHAFHLPNWWGHWFEGSLVAVDADAVEGAGSLVWVAMGAGTLAMLVGIGLAWTRYKDGTPDVDRAFAQTAFGRLLMDKWRVDELYEAVILRPARAAARFAGNVDRYFVDAILAGGTALAVKAGGWAFTRIQNGVVYAYGAVMLVGIVVLGWWFLYPHAGVEGTAEDGGVRWVAGRGMGYEYRWDVNGDGVLDSTEWSGAHHVVASYGPEDYVGAALVIATDRPGGDVIVELDPGGGRETLGEGLLRPGWEQDREGNRRPPTVRWDPEGRRVLLRPNDAAVRAPGIAEGAEVALAPGDSFQIGVSFLRVVPIVRATVEVRNSFGNVSSASRELVLHGRPSAPQAAIAPAGGAR